MTDLSDLLRARAAFDEARVEPMFLKTIEQSDGGTKLLWFENGLIEENTRLQPLLEALIEVACAAEEANELSKEDATRYPQMDAALIKLRELVAK